MTAIPVDADSIAAPRVPHMSFDDAMTQVRACHAAGYPISDGAALTIAAAWQGPSYRDGGATFAALIGHFPVTIDDLARACRLARFETPDTLDHRALLALMFWADNARRA